MKQPLLALVLTLTLAVPASAQDYGGYFSTLFSVMPNAGREPGGHGVAEMRARLFAEGLVDVGDHLHLTLGLVADGLVADRTSTGGRGTTADAILRPADAYVELRMVRFDLRAGMSRVAWGRLDEIQPTDVVNPLDLTRFLLEGRGEARLPVGLVRGRVYLPGESTIEAILVPVFRPGRFDQLDEETSPFRLTPAAADHIDRREPQAAWQNMQGGARFTSTVGRMDWGLSAWHGFESFPVVAFGLKPEAGRTPEATLVESFPRFTMVGADFETVRGAWGVRGELAWFDAEISRSFEGGIGADRRAGDYRLAANVLVTRADDTDVTLIGSAERRFLRDARTVRVLAVYDPVDDTSFIRGIAAVNLRDNVWLEGSGGWFTGESPDVLGQLSTRDFLYARIRLHF